MTPAQSILADLVDLGVTIQAHSDKLRVCPSSAVPAELRDRIRAYRGELLALLARAEDPPTERGGGSHGQRGGPGPGPTMYMVDGQLMTWVERAEHWRRADEHTGV